VRCPRISLIAAMAENRVIGREGAIPWDLPKDRRHFRELTWGHPVVMGRRTFETIGRPLPGRTNIVLTRQPDYVAPGCIVVHDLRDALEAAGEAAEVFILGGGEVYREALPVASRLYLTVVRGEVEGDVRFPEVPVGEFREVERREIDDTLPCTFVVFERHAPHA